MTGYTNCPKCRHRVALFKVHACDFKKEPTNHDRAQNAEFAVKTYILMIGETARAITEEDISDLITDLLHLAKYLDLPKGEIINRALSNLNAEKVTP